MVAPGASRAIVWYFGQSLSAMAEPASAWMSASAIKYHSRVPRGKSNCGPITPITVNGSALMRTVIPTMSGALPNWDVHSTCDIMTTLAPRSACVNARPIIGLTSSVEKRFSVMEMPVTCRAPPLSPSSV